MPEPRDPSPARTADVDKPAGADKDTDQLLDTGQEEVFSREEVERGDIEHATDAGKSGETTGSPRSPNAPSPPLP